MKKTQHYQVVIEQDEDGIYVGTVLGLPSCYSDGKTVDELMKNLHDAILLCEKQKKKEASVGRNSFIGVRDLMLQYT